MTLPDTIQSAAKAKLEADIKPTAEKLGKIRALLVAYEEAFRKDAEQKVQNAVMIALGQELLDVTPARVPPIERELRQAVKELLGDDASAEEPASPPLEPPRVPLIGTEEPAKPSIKRIARDADTRVNIHPTDPPTASPVTLPSPPPTPPPPPVQLPPTPPSPSTPSGPSAFMKEMNQRLKPDNTKARSEDVDAAIRLLAEIDDLKATIKTQHPMRLLPLLQAIVAEVRHTIDRLPAAHPLGGKLSRCIPVLGALKAEGGVKDFIHGLAFGVKSDWPRLIQESRRKVAQFDMDAEKPLHEDRKSNGKKEIKGTHAWPELPQLRSLKRPILLAGGMRIPEKLDSIQQRFGLRPEWHAIDHDNPKASETLMLRVKAGKVGAVILLEGFMKHTTFKPVVDACALAGIPVAMADKGGVASIQGALDELESKLSKKGASS